MPFDGLALGFQKSLSTQQSAKGTIREENSGHRILGPFPQAHKASLTHPVFTNIARVQPVMDSFLIGD